MNPEAMQARPPTPYPASQIEPGINLIDLRILTTNSAFQALSSMSHDRLYLLIIAIIFIFSLWYQVSYKSRHPTHAYDWRHHIRMTGNVYAQLLQ